MNKEAEVRVSYNSLINPKRFDIALFWKNERFISWANETGYQGLEFLPLRGAAKDVIRKPIKVLTTLPEIKSGHVFYNPYATLWSIATKKPDPLRPGEKIAPYNIGMADAHIGKAALQKLEQAFTGFPVVNYPYEVGGKNPYGEYQNQWLQTHPAVFNDQSNANDLIKLVKSGKYQGVVWDTFHALEQTRGGGRPLGNWGQELGKMLEAGIIKEIHVQAARATEKYGKIADLEWAKDMTGEYPKYNNELAKMIKLVKSIDPNVPFTVEISPQGLLNAGILEPKSSIRTTGDLQDIHREIIDYIKRV